MTRYPRVQTSPCLPIGTAFPSGGSVLTSVWPLAPPTRAPRRARGSSTLLLGDKQLGGDDAAVVEKLVMREQHALGRTGGSGRVLNIDDVVAVGGAWTRFDAAVDHPLPRIFAEIDDVAKCDLLSSDCVLE